MNGKEEEGQSKLLNYAGYKAQFRLGTDRDMVLMGALDGVLKEVKEKAGVNDDDLALDALRKSAEVINNGNLTLRVNEMAVFVQNNEGRDVLPAIIKKAVEEISQVRKDENREYPVGEPKFPW